ncbi:hypothetical protein EIP91_005256 [Steccherinum ochraceum]|uniref:tripeptidyl-peptidase II n=1 Tax=Steccherinum ochraceum TaxID=92696 RepID=A0A4R0RQG7_9APHY|nr:hypothetical protein EIP91_005256 [Steccherinum ochraceum]
MKLSAAFVVLSFAALAAAIPSHSYPHIHQLKESISSPDGWVQNGRAPRDAIIELRIVLPQSNWEELERHLYEVSDPMHSRYGQHLSVDEVNALLAPHQDSTTAVDEWLATHGFTEADVSRSPAKDWVKVKVPISVAESMMDTEYHVWTHPGTGKSIMRTTTYSLPSSVHGHIEFIQPTTLFSSPRGMAASFRQVVAAPPDPPANSTPIAVPSAYNGHVDASCNETITLSCLQQLYNAVGYTPSADNGNQIGITGYLAQFANLADLQSFYADQRPDALNSSFTFVSVNGGLNNQTQEAAGVEANLDVQYAFGLTHPTPGTFWSTAGSPPFTPDELEPDNESEPYANWLDYVLSHPNPPQTISTSYGDSEQTVPESYASSVCRQFAQLGARGVSVLFSSGDFGVGDNDPDPSTTKCHSNDGNNTLKFLPIFPASCPFVTAVGGTTQVPEIAANFSEGGFSDRFARPSYQNDAVSSYLNQKLPNGTYAGLYNSSGRAYPDVSAQSDNFRFFFTGTPHLVGGTSAASPTFAAIVSLLNDARLSNHMPPLGFLNPLLYKIAEQYPNAFNDITVGNNPGCGTPGFNATTGWDPVTGLGTPNFAVLKDIVTRNGTFA